MQIHGFYCNIEEKIIRFDIVIDFAAPNFDEVRRNVIESVKKIYPDYNISILSDLDYSD